MVEVKLFFPLSRMANKRSTGLETFSEGLAPDETLRSLLARLAARYEGLSDVFDATSGDLHPSVLVVLNDRVMTYPHNLDIKLRDKDSLGLLPEFAGG